MKSSKQWPASSFLLGLCALSTVVPTTIADREQEPLSASPRSSRDPFTKSFDSFVQETIDEWKVAGVAIAVVDGDEIFSKGYGFATLPDTPATPETLWYAGSTTKAFTAATLSHMINSGEYPELSRGWQTPISSIIRDDFVLQDQWATEHITLEDAVCHRTGQFDPGLGWQDDSNVKQIVRNIRNYPMVAPPRTRFLYNNDMYCTLSHVIETLTGKQVGDVFRDLIWSPLGMNSTYLDLQDALDGPDHLSTGYFWNKTSKQHQSLPFLTTGPVSGAGATISNVVDYTKWIKSLLRQEGPLSKEVHRDIQTPRFLDQATPAQGLDVSLYSLAWWRTTLHGNVVYWHSGSTSTHGALVYWLPDLDYGVVMMTNYASPCRQVLMNKLVEDRLGTATEHRYNISDDLREAEREADRQLEHIDDLLFPNRPKEPMPPALDLSEYVGDYYSEGYGWFQFREQDDDCAPYGIVLVARPAKQFWHPEIKLRFVSGEFWVALVTIIGASHPIPVATEFRLGIDGKIEGMWMDYREVNSQETSRVFFERKP